MPELGEKIRFRPAGFEGEGNDPKPMGWLMIPREVTGRIVYINPEHRFFDVAFEVHGYTFREAFKF